MSCTDAISDEIPVIPEIYLFDWEITPPNAGFKSGRTLANKIFSHKMQPRTMKQNRELVD